MSLTFQGASLEVVIFKGGTKITPENFPAFFRSIASCHIQVSQGETSNFTLKLTPTFDDALKILSSGIIGSGIGPSLNLPDDKTASIVSSGETPTEDETKTVTGSSNFTYYAVRLYYQGGDSTPYYGGFTCQPSFSLGSTIDITIKVTGAHNLMAIAGGPIRFENEPALDVLKKLGDPFGIEFTFDDEDADTEAVLSATNISGSYNEDYDGVIRRILTDLRCTYVKYDGDGSSPKPQYRVKSSKYLASQEPMYTFVMYRQVAPEDGVIPIEDLSLESNGNLFAPGNVFGTFSKAVLSRTKETKSENSAPSSFQGAGTSGSKSDSGAMPLDDGSASEVGGAVGLVDPGAQIAGNHSSAVHRDDASTLGRAGAKAEMAAMNMLQYNAKLPGLPGLRPQTTVNLLIGSGKDGLEAFCGPCYVMSLEHDWSSEGWTTDAKIHKSAGPIFNPSASEKPTSEAPAPSNKVTVKATKL